MNKYLSISFVVVILLLSTHAFLGVHSMRFLSPTYDEHVHLTAGYSYLKTRDYRLNSFDHPPFSEMWAAMPLLFLKPIFPLQHPYWSEIWKYQYAFSDIFVYKNKVDPQRMLYFGRTMILLLSLALGLCIYFFSKELFGQIPSYIAMFLWSFSPVFIAHGTLVTTDMALTLFYFLSIYMLWRWYKSTGPEISVPLYKSILAGLSLGLLLASKYSAVVIFPVIGSILVVYWLKVKVSTKDVTGLLFWSIVSVFAVLFIVYQFNSLSIYYLIGLKKVLTGVSQGRSSFLLGEHSTNGWIYYFPVTFFLKTPLPLIILFFGSLFIFRLWTLENLLFLFLPAFFYFASSCYSKVNIGHRHILPIYPFLIVWVSGLFLYMNKKTIRAVSALLLLWYGYGSLKAYPWYLSYFNEVIGSTDNGYKYLTDSNIDWGQGLKELGKYLKAENVSGIYLCYFGIGDPHYYGIKYEPMGFVDNISYPNAKGHRDGDKIDFSKEPRILLAVSVSNLQATYYADKKIFSWLKDIPYEKMIGHSILVYDMGKYPAQYEKLLEMLK
ncbi:MAG: phospholipid carrier-dependent glycosyltransferase [Elusimicrobia bacterium]|nr:phospholipid carrier-dependent glycosyltransferase [Candidatus Liberimonas magnetica]